MQSKNKDGSIQFSKRYWAYMLAKRHFTRKCSSEVFPIGGKNGKDTERTEQRKQKKEVIAIQHPDRLINSKQGGDGFDTTGISYTLRAQGAHGLLQDSQIRRLTPTECERLQGFPDGWTEYGMMRCDLIKSHTDKGECIACGGKGYYSVGISDTQRYKCLGNAVTTNVITEIGRRLI